MKKKKRLKSGNCPGRNKTIKCKRRATYEKERKQKSRCKENHAYPYPTLGYVGSHLKITELYMSQPIKLHNFQAKLWKRRVYLFSSNLSRFALLRQAFSLPTFFSVPSFSVVPLPFMTGTLYLVLLIVTIHTLWVSNFKKFLSVSSTEEVSN